MDRLAPLASRLLMLLGRYETALDQWMTSQAPSTMEMDWCFAALRLQQRVRWPQGARLVDAVGLRAEELLLVSRLHGRASSECGDAKAAHAAALGVLREGIAEMNGEKAAA